MKVRKTNVERSKAYDPKNDGVRALGMIYAQI